MKRLLFAAVIVLSFSASLVIAQEKVVKKKRPLPHDYGKVVMNNFSESNKMSPVVFDHWLHRAKFACKLCHADIGFSLKAGSTGIRAADNISGYYCGTCHNGKMKINDKTIFESCKKEALKEDKGTCDRCHSYGKDVKREYNFAAFTAGLPKERYGNGIDWEKAERDGNIKLISELPGVTFKRKQMPVQKDFGLEPKIAGLPEIVFSHQKHNIWNGCDICHPDIFAGVKKGAVKYSMTEIFDGKFCGVCHGTVSFPNIDCQRCHVKPV